MEIEASVYCDLGYGPSFYSGGTYDSETEFESVPISDSKVDVVSISVQLVPTYNFG
jgi:hypothetical protein